MKSGEPEKRQVPPGCPLTYALYEVAFVAANLDEIACTVLAVHLSRSPNTIRTEWERIHKKLKCKSSWQVIDIGRRDGWLPQSNKKLEADKM